MSATSLLASGTDVGAELSSGWRHPRVIGALRMLLSRKPVHSALFVALTMINLAILYGLCRPCSSGWCRSSSTPAQS